MTNRSSHLRASTNTVTDAAAIGVPLLSSLDERHLVVISGARATQPEPPETSPANAHGARAWLSRLIRSFCNGAASERRDRDRVVGAADAPAPGDADATCAYGVVPSRSSGARAVEAATFLSSFARWSPVGYPSFSRPSLVVVSLISHYIPCYFPTILSTFSRPTPALLPSSFSFSPAG